MGSSCPGPTTPGSHGPEPSPASGKARPEANPSRPVTAVERTDAPGPGSGALREVLQEDDLCGIETLDDLARRLFATDPRAIAWVEEHSDWRGHTIPESMLGVALAKLGQGEDAEPEIWAECLERARRMLA